MDREALLEEEREARLSWDAAVASVPRAATGEPALNGGRSLKDLVAHIAAWQRWADERLTARGQGRPPQQIPDWHAYEHAFNQRVDERWRQATWDEVAAEATAAYAAFRAAMEALEPAQLERAAELIRACGSAHYAEYIGQIRAYVDSLPPRLVIETARLRLRSFRPSDADFMYGLFADPEVMRYIPPGQPLTIERVRRSADRRRAQEEGTGLTLWMVEKRDGAEPIGNCGFALVEGTGPEVELAYHYSRGAWGQGYGTEAAIACLRHGFGPLGLERVIAICDPRNVGSWRVMEKAGMRADGEGQYYGSLMKRYVAERGSWRPPERSGSTS